MNLCIPIDDLRHKHVTTQLVNIFMLYLDEKLEI